VTDAAVEALLALSKLQYECMEYAVASRQLSFCRRLMAGDSDRCSRAMWGKLAADIMLERWDDADGGIRDLHSAIDKVHSFVAV
jgi:translation initiation factor 3 subunit E